MSNKRNYKNYPISNIEDALEVLGGLISGVQINLEKYEMYSNEIIELYQKYEDKAKINEKIFIPAKEYDDINDKLLYRQREILKYVADHQNSSFSYIKLKEILKKKNIFNIAEDKKASSILKDLLDLRNWSFHNPQSLLVASKEVAKRNIPSNLKSCVEIKPQLNPVIIFNTVSYDIHLLYSLHIHVKKMSAEFKIILNQMKCDYQHMYDSIPNKPCLFLSGNLSNEVVFLKKDIKNSFDNYAIDITQLSMGMQKSKYDGTDTSYNNWVINKSLSFEDNTTLNNKKEKK